VSVEIGGAFFVHPTITKLGKTLLSGLNSSVIELMFDTTRMIINIVVTGARLLGTPIGNGLSGSNGALKY
jgi:hypothetical protein